MRFACLICVALLCLCGSQKLAAQELNQLSKPITLNFGYPELKIMDDLQFIEEEENNSLDPDESGLISFTVKNVGSYTAYGVAVVPEELNGIEGVYLPSEITIGDLKPGESQLVQIGIEADSNLEKGSASLSFKILENKRFQDISIVYSFQTNQ
ncbi:MAG: hypothetical protein AAFV07_11635 [Bacteroidota bacterium]